MEWGLWITVGVVALGGLALLLALVGLAATQLAHDHDRDELCGCDRDRVEPDAVDGVEVPNPIDLQAWGGRRGRRARLLDAERRVEFPEP